MAFALADRVRETSTTTGTGNLTLAGTVQGFRTFTSVLTAGDTTWYAIVGGADWEVGLGTLVDSTTLARTTVLASSNAGAAVSLAAGSKDVFITPPATLLNRLADFGFVEATVTAATTSDVGAANSRKVLVSGSGAAITSLGTKAHVEKLVRFDGANTLTHNATSLILPGKANIATAAGDTALVTSDGSGNVRIRHYQRADGTPVAGAGPTLDSFRALAMQVAKLKAAPINMVDGFVDDLRDQTGYDVAGSANAAWDSASDTISNQSQETAESLPAMTGNSAPSGYTASASTFHSAGYEAYRAYNDNPSDGWDSGASSLPAWNERQTPTAVTIGIIKIKGHATVGGYEPKDFKIQGYNGSTWVDMLTVTGATWTTGVAQAFTIPVGNRAAYARTRLYVTAVSGGYNEVIVYEIEVLQAISGALNFKSNVWPAQAVPTKAAIYLRARATAGSISLNTNLIVSISRDGGTTEADFAMALLGTDGLYSIFGQNNLDISGLGSGLNMKPRLRTNSGLVVQFDGWEGYWG